MKILTVIGARPQFIKAATISRALNKYGTISEFIVHTGQHYDDNMSGIFFRELDLPEPDINLNIGSGPHGKQTGQMLEAIERIMVDQQPSCVLVYGDTNSTLAGALAASKLNIPVCHVEAGLRSFNRMMPEEKNRIVTDHLSDLLFAPTQNAKLQLLREGIPDNRIIVSGDVMYDACLYYKGKSERQSTIAKKLGLNSRDYVLATFHRAENTDNPDRLNRIVNELNALSRHYRVICPLHPRTRKLIGKLPQLNNACKIEFVDPVGYIDMVYLEANASALITDSGGMQKEAYFHSKPCLTLRNETEWTELIDMGWNKLYPPIQENEEPILSALQSLLESTPSGGKRNCYGTGDSAHAIIKSIEDSFGITTNN